MNQTYTIEPIELKKSNQTRFEVKQRLIQMRTRAKKMLDKHNWEKYFTESGDLVSNENNVDFNLTSTTIFTETSTLVSSLNIFCKSSSSTYQELSKLNLFNSSKSCIDNLEYDSLLMSSNETNMSKFQINIMPLLNVTSEQNLNKNTNKMFQSIDTNNDDYKLNIPKNFKYTPVVMNKKRSLTRQQESLTFIADLASTSTPTRNSTQPITSTPKVSNHNPLKYHPTHTIRNKAKRQYKKETRVYKLNINALKYTTKISKNNLNRVNLKRKYQSSESLGSNESFQECHNCKNCNLSDLIVSKIQTSKQMINSNKKSKILTNNSSNKKHKLKLKGSNIEISLGDLLYTPSKLKTTKYLNHQQAVQPISKVYYL